MTTHNLPVETESKLTAVQTVVDDLDAYLSQWLQRLQQELRTDQASAADDASLQAQLQQLQLRQEQWEVQRRHQQQQLRDQAEQLTAAWLRLEDEQRRLLQGGTVGQRAANHTPPRQSSCPSVSNAGTPASPVASAAVNSSPGSTREAAIAQFQQLRREIDVHRPLAHD